MAIKLSKYDLLVFCFVTVRMEIVLELQDIEQGFQIHPILNTFRSVIEDTIVSEQLGEFVPHDSQLE